MKSARAIKTKSLRLIFRKTLWSPDRWYSKWVFYVPEQWRIQGGGGGGGAAPGARAPPPPLPDDSLNIHDVFCVPRAIITARNSAAVSYSADTCTVTGADLGGGGGGGGGGTGGTCPPPIQ